MNTANTKTRLIVMSFLQFAVWGAYLTSMGNYLAGIGLFAQISRFYAIQGIVSLFMPALMGIVADRWIPAQKLLGICHAIAGALMLIVYYYTRQIETVSFPILFTLYSFSVAFYMPTLALSNSVSYSVLERAGLDLVKSFPPIRIFGTIGFICSMWLVDLLGMQETSAQFALSGCIGLVLAAYSFTLPSCAVGTQERGEQRSLFEALGLDAFRLFRHRRMLLFFIFSMLLGVSLQITNGFANPYIHTFSKIEEYAHTYAAHHPNMIISISQISETLCILLIPFALKKFGIKRVMLIAMGAWVLRFGLLGLGNPGSELWLFILSMIVYGVAFDFFNVSGSLFVDMEVPVNIRSSAQGLFMIMTNGIGATLGSFAAQAVINHFVPVYESLDPDAFYSLDQASALISGWSTSWFIFAAYALLIAVLFALLFRYKPSEEEAKPLVN